MSLPLRIWWPVAVWTVAIAFFTTVPATGPPIPRSVPQPDKLVHFGLYLGLGWSLGRALWLSRRATAGAVILALGSGLAFAVANEWLQRFVPTRVPSAADWLADAAGVSLGIALYLWPRVRRASGPGKAALSGPEAGVTGPETGVTGPETGVTGREGGVTGTGGPG